MEQYRTEEEQVEALKKWWEENGRSTIVAVIVALGLGFGWQGWQKYQQNESEGASSRYQAMLQSLAGEDNDGAADLAETIKQEYSRSTYAQFAALHLARLAVNEGDLARAEAELRWVLGRADKGSDTMQLAQLRLARVLAATGDTAQALNILASADPGAYASAYQVARGDILLMEARNEEAREAYSSAMMLASRGQGQLNMAMLRQKLQSLSQQAPRELPATDEPEVGAASAATAAEENTEN
ncbi:tetratricopeptide repeat protein [Seongchinamella unica]|uniref:Ancillary SecYEG translocon subunit n=1 Tax=Seongchinamella unica TaxID=2547392 RepID=A0A4V2ZXG2_9GAMM|nr:tetratricopeptide repeat protein [Seongchinamella unica]TDG14895.1 tetratricopeptide repeat protein [Seongchinamella unica]